MIYTEFNSILFGNSETSAPAVDNKIPRPLEETGGSGYGVAVAGTAVEAAVGAAVGGGVGVKVRVGGKVALGTSVFVGVGVIVSVGVSVGVGVGTFKFRCRRRSACRSASVLFSQIRRVTFPAGTWLRSQV